MGEFSVRDSRVLVESPIMTVRQDQVVMPDGSVGNREIVEHFGAVAIAALYAGKLALIRQYRHSVRQHLWELPAGLLDMAGEDPLQAAGRELQEEVGLAAGSWAHVVDVVSSPGFCDEAVRVYAAFDTYEVPRPPAEAEEADLEITYVTVEEAVAMVLAGEIVNATAVAGILALAQRLQDPAFQQQAVSTEVASNATVGGEFQLRPQALAERRIAAGMTGDLKRLHRQ